MDGGGEFSAERGIEPLPIVYESDYPGEIEETFEEYMTRRYPASRFLSLEQEYIDSLPNDNKG